MSISQEIVARIGADTSGFKKGVDEVAQQSAVMKNNMRVAFSAGYQGAKDLRGALRGVADMAGQTQGPIGQIASGVQSIFHAFKANPILGIAAAAAAGVALIARGMNSAAEEAKKRVEELAEAAKNTMQLLKTLQPEKYDKVFQAAEEAQTFVNNKSDIMLKKRIEAVDKERDAMAEQDKLFAKQRSTLPQTIADMKGERSAIEGSRRTGPTGAPLPLSAEKEGRLSYLNAKILEQEKALNTAISADTGDEAKARKEKADQLMRIRQIYLDAQKRISDDRKNATEKEENERKRRDEKEKNDAEAAVAEAKKSYDAKLQSERELQISELELQGKSSIGIKKKFALQDIDSALKEQANATNLTERNKADAKLAEAKTRLNALQMEENRDAKRATEQRKEDIKQNREARQDLFIEQQSGTRRGQNILRRQFERQNYQELQERIRTAPPSERIHLQTELINLTREMLRTNRNIEKKTGKGAKG